MKTKSKAKKSGQGGRKAQKTRRSGSHRTGKSSAERDATGGSNGTESA